MFRILASVLVLLLPALCFSQAYPPYQLAGVYWGADLGVRWQKTTLSHRDQITLTGNKPVAEFGLTATNPLAWKIRYIFTMSPPGSEEITPGETLVVGSTSFGVKGGKASEKDIVQIDWSVGPNQRMELVLLGLNTRPSQFWLQPAVACEWLQGSITAEKSDGTTKTRDIERHNSLFAAAGVEAAYDLARSRTTVFAVGSPNYQFIKLAHNYSVANRWNIGFGWQWKRFKLERESGLSQSGGFLTVNGRW